MLLSEHLPNEQINHQTSGTRRPACLELLMSMGLFSSLQGGMQFCLPAHTPSRAVLKRDVLGVLLCTAFLLMKYTLCRLKTLL